MRDLSFHATAAQVIPVLLIALGFEARAFARPRSEAEMLGFVFVVAYAAIAEMLAMLALMEAGGGIRERLVNEWIIWGAIVVQMIMLMFVAGHTMVKRDD